MQELFECREMVEAEEKAREIRINNNTGKIKQNIKKREQYKEENLSKINTKKTKHMFVGNNRDECEKSMKVTTRTGEEDEFDKIEEFTHLGLLSDENGQKTKEIKARTIRDNQKHGSLKLYTYKEEQSCESMK